MNPFFPFAGGPSKKLDPVGVGGAGERNAGLGDAAFLSRMPMLVDRARVRRTSVKSG
jgi:hypothetical protein